MKHKHQSAIIKMKTMSEEITEPEPIELAKDLAANERLAEVACARLRSELEFSDDELKAARQMLSTADFRAQSWDSLLSKTIVRQEAKTTASDSDDSNGEEGDS